MPGFAPPAESPLSPMMMIVVAPRVVGTRGTKLSLLCCVVLGGVFACWIRRCCAASLCCRSSLPTRSDQTSSRPVPSGSTSESWPMEVLVSLYQAVILQLSNPVIFCDFLKKMDDIVGVVNAMGLSTLFILMTQYGLDYPCFYEKADGVSEAKADLKIEDQIVGNRNDSTGSDLPKKPGFNLFRNASGPSKLLTPEVPSTTKIAVQIKLMFTKLWISFLRLPLPLDVYKEVSSKRIATRSLLQSPILLLLLLWVHRAVGENGTASYYGPPYERTECYGEGSSQFPVSDLFAAVGDGLWDMGAACGREYELRCISNGPGACKPGTGNIRVKVVDYALSVGSSAAAPRQSVTGADLVLSHPAFEAIANPSVDSIRVEFKRL